MEEHDRRTGALVDVSKPEAVVGAEARRVREVREPFKELIWSAD